MLCKDWIDFYDAFRNVGESSGVYLFEDKIFYTRRCFWGSQSFYDLCFGDKFSNEALNETAETYHCFDALLESTNCDSITIFNVEHPIQWKAPLIKKYYVSLCEVPAFEITKPETLRAVKKAKKIYQLTDICDEQRILDFINTYQAADGPENAKRQALFLSEMTKQGKALCFAACENNKIDALMGVLIDGSCMYMVFCKYDPSCLHKRPNDFLYEGLLQYAKNNAVTSINWGNTQSDDSGLISFKKKYSTKTLTRYCACYFSPKFISRLTFKGDG